MLVCRVRLQVTAESSSLTFTCELCMHNAICSNNATCLVPQDSEKEDPNTIMYLKINQIIYKED